MGGVIRKTTLSAAQIAEVAKSRLVGKVGWFEGATYEDGTPVAYVATIQEFGYPAGKIPSRSFMRTTIAEQETAWKKLMLSGAKAMFLGNETMDTVLQKMAMRAEGDIRLKINSINEPALRPWTLAARKKRGNSSVKPLNDTGYMLSTFTSALVEE